MKLKLHITFIIFFLFSLCTLAENQILRKEILNYKVMFKWGLVHKQAGRATLSIAENGNKYIATLIARSEPWADKFYSVRDTLISTMSATDFLPEKYERIAYEGGSFAHDIVSFSRKGNQFSAETERYRKKKKATEITKTTGTLKAEGHTVDLLSVFYYLRAMKFEPLTPGYSKTINIFSGKKRELLHIKYLGEEQLNLDGKKYDTYKISFTFTTGGSNKSSDDILTWISTDVSHVPLKLEGKLKVGRIQCLYTGGK
ncbi:MAG: DUF3108 domain-containing protein [Paramuribaculum sp.]|nr:DUF3108 domain-containing protein [Paramuribaculum sp.]